MVSTGRPRSTRRRWIPRQIILPIIPEDPPIVNSLIFNTIAKRRVWCGLLATFRAVKSLSLSTNKTNTLVAPVQLIQPLDKAWCRTTAVGPLSQKGLQTTRCEIFKFSWSRSHPMSSKILLQLHQNSRTIWRSPNKIKMKTAGKRLKIAWVASIMAQIPITVPQRQSWPDSHKIGQC